MTVWFVRYGATQFGGAENYLRRVVDALEHKGVDVGVFSTQKYGYKTVLLPSRGKIPMWLYLDRLATNIQKVKDNYLGTLFSLERLPCADIYRAGDGVHRAWLDIKATRQSSIKTKFDNLSPLHNTYLSLEAKTFENSKIIIANSNRGADEIVYYYGTPRDKIRVIYNGAPHPIDMPDKQKAKDSLENELNLQKNIPLILYAGNGFFRKGVKDFLYILSLIRAPFNALVVGRDKKQSQYEAYAKSLGLQNRVKFVGAQTDMAKFYASADVFLFPTLYEPFSNACLEAMGYGCALFTTAQNGASEILPDSSTIIYNDESAATMLDALIMDKLAMERLSAIHRQVALKYDVKQNVDATLSVIKELN